MCCFRFYWSVNLGALVAYSLDGYICQYGIPALGGKEYGFFVGYSIPAIMMGMSLKKSVVCVSFYMD